MLVMLRTRFAGVRGDAESRLALGLQRVIGEKNNLLSNFNPATAWCRSDRRVCLVSTIATGTTSRHAWVWRGTLAQRQDGRTRRLGLFYDAFSQDFFAGQLPFNTFNPGPAFNPVGSSPFSSRFPPSARFRTMCQSLPTFRFRRFRCRSASAHT
jgi:hypothetical protein